MRGGFDALGDFGGEDGGSAEPLLDIADLTVRFGGLVALRSVSLNVPTGSVVAVIGPNGSESPLYSMS